MLLLPLAAGGQAAARVVRPGAGALGAHPLHVSPLALIAACLGACLALLPSAACLALPARRCLPGTQGVVLALGRVLAAKLLLRCLGPCPWPLASLSGPAPPGPPFHCCRSKQETWRSRRALSQLFNVEEVPEEEEEEGEGEHAEQGQHAQQQQGEAGASGGGGGGAPPAAGGEAAQGGAAQ